MPGFGLWLTWFTSWWMNAEKFYDVPQNAWFYEGMRRAKREGLLVGYPDGLHSPKVGDRWESAVKLYAVVRNHIGLMENVDEEPPEGRRLLIRLRSFIPTYERGFGEFAPQLLALGVRGDLGIARLRSLYARFEATLPIQYFPFPDVPERHWAAEAISVLRANDLIHGYPSGRYGG